MADLGLEKGNKGAALFLRRQQAAEQSALVKEGEESKSDAVNTTRSTFQDPINAKVVRKSSFRSSQSSQPVEQVKAPPQAPKPAARPKPTPKPVVEIEPTPEPIKTTGSTQVKREPPRVAENALVEENEAIPASKATSNALVEPTEALTSTATMLDQVAGKLSSLKHDDEDDVFAQEQQPLQRMDEHGEIVYDDPGSVKDIRKKFGVRTNPEFAQPRAAPLLSGRNSRSSSIAQDVTQSLNSSFTSESPKRLSSHRYSTEADKIFKEAIDQTQNTASSTSSQSSLPPVDRSGLPPRPKPKPKPKPDRKTSRPSSTTLPGYLQSQNTDILSQIEIINKMTMNYESFDAAIADFYVNVAKLDASIMPPVNG